MPRYRSYTLAVSLLVAFKFNLLDRLYKNKNLSKFLDILGPLKTHMFLSVWVIKKKINIGVLLAGELWVELEESPKLNFPLGSIKSWAGYALVCCSIFFSILFKDLLYQFQE